MGKRREAAPLRELLRVDLRDKYRHEHFFEWEGADLSAQHRFVPAEEPGVVRMSFTKPRPHVLQAGRVLDSKDGGETWYEAEGWHPPCDRGLYAIGPLRLALYRGGRECWRSSDGGGQWMHSTVPHAQEQQLDGLGAPNCFSAIMLTRGIHAGRIVMVSDYFLGQEGPDGELLGATYSDDWGQSWHCSRLFGPPEPLPTGPEGFGEPAVVELPSGWLWMVFRSLYGELWQCISHDGGETWGRPSPTGIVSPIANCYAAREPYTGATVLAWNMTRPGMSPEFRAEHGLYRPRTNLVFAVSHDNTRTWSCPVVVEPEGGQYPTLHFAAGRMFIMYQSSGREPQPWHRLGLTLVAYDTRDVLRLPAWTLETIQPYVEAGLVRPWRAVACRPASRETIS